MPKGPKKSKKGLLEILGFNTISLEYFSKTLALRRSLKKTRKNLETTQDIWDEINRLREEGGDLEHQARNMRKIEELQARLSELRY